MRRGKSGGDLVACSHQGVRFCAAVESHLAGQQLDGGRGDTAFPKQARGGSAGAQHAEQDVDGANTAASDFGQAMGFGHRHMMIGAGRRIEQASRGRGFGPKPCL